MCLHLLLQGFEVSSFQRRKKKKKKRKKKKEEKIDSVMGQFDGVAV